jgi:hypothetical protein
VPPEDGRLTPETCRGLRHNKVFVKVKVYSVGYVIAIHAVLQQVWEVGGVPTFPISSLDFPICLCSWR